MPSRPIIEKFCGLGRATQDKVSSGSKIIYEVLKAESMPSRPIIEKFCGLGRATQDKVSSGSRIIYEAGSPEVIYNMEVRCFVRLFPATAHELFADN